MRPRNDSPGPDLPRDLDQLTREVDASIKVREIREWERLRHGLRAGWKETFLLAGLFAFSIGLAATVIFGLPQENKRLYYFMVLWILGFAVMLTLSIAFLIRKLRVMRRIMELSIRRMERLEKEAGEGKKRKQEMKSSR